MAQIIKSLVFTNFTILAKVDLRCMVLRNIHPCVGGKLRYSKTRYYLRTFTKIAVVGVEPTCDMVYLTTIVFTTRIFCLWSGLFHIHATAKVV